MSGFNRKKGSRRRKIRIGGQLRDFDELRTLKSSELKIGTADEKDYKNLRWRYKKDGDVEFVEDDDNLADDDIVFGGSKSDIRRIEDLERNISVLATKLMTTDGAATDSDDDNFGTVVNKKTRFKDDVRFTGSVDFDDNILVLNKDVSGTPSENAGLEIRRGTSTNAKLLWNETSDHWEIASGGTTGRILTVSDEGTGNGLDADTLDGEEGSYYLDYNNFTNTPSSSSGIFTASGSLNSTQTHDGTVAVFDLDSKTATATADTGLTNTSGSALSISSGSFTADGRGIFYISDSNKGTYEDMVIRTNGTGSAATGGFVNPTGANSVFGFRGFSNTTSGQRILTTALLDCTNYETLEFYLIQGNGSNGGETTDANDDMDLYYSVNGGSYVSIQKFTGSPRLYDSWAQVKIELPTAAKTTNVRFRWINRHTSSGDYDHWGVSLVRLHNGANIAPSFTVSTEGVDNIVASESGITLTTKTDTSIKLDGGVTQLFNTTADPTENLEKGQMYFNSSTNKFRGYNGTAWVDLG